MDVSIDWKWVVDHVGAMWTRFGQHLQLVTIAVIAGFAISLVLAVWAHRRPRLYAPITGITGLLYTIPSLAAFALLRPFTGLTLLTAVIPLTTYTLLILVRANVAGFNSVPADVIEAAEGMGYTRRERLLRVEMPLALPMIMAGIRLAVVTTIGLATVAAILGESFGGFGFFITEGLDRFFLTEIYVGAVLSIVMAFAADFLLVRVERLITPWARARAQAH
jgi:osmoprotectant transport system permease protein